MLVSLSYRRGLTKVVYSFWGAVREPDMWDKQNSSHAFFLSGFNLC